MADEDPEGLGPVADELYGLDPADFVAGRAELVRRLRAEKRRDLAAAVAKLRRPSPAAWAVNQLVRGRRDDVEALVRLGEALRDAQGRALEGADAAELRQAARARRDALAALTGAAAHLLATRGGGVDAHLPGVTATLEAASLDQQVGATVLEGRLAAELDPPSGFGDLDVELAARPPVRSRAAEPEPEAGPPQREVGEAERAVAEAGRRAEELATAARSAAHRAGQRRKAVEEAEAEVARLRHRLEEAEGRRAALVIEAEEAGQAASQAAAAAAEAAARLHDAKQRLRQASR